MVKKNYLKGITLNRTIGVEVEGYSADYRNMRNNGVRHSNLKYDGSLTGSRHGLSGVEVVTKPINNLDLLDEVFEDITAYQWNCGRGTAGTHIHVDANDYMLEDRLKMAIFMNLIETAMFLLVKKYRYSRRKYYRNQYCQPIQNGWKQVLKKLDEHRILNWRQYKKLGNLIYDLRTNPNRPYIGTPTTVRYQFVNIWSSSHDTIEFRIFHAIRDAKEAKMFALLAYSLVEVVKHSTLEHLEYLADVIMNKSTSAEDMIKKLTESVGLEHLTYKIQNKDLAYRVNRDKQRATSSQFVAI
jgi:hypothetical protein